MAQVTFIISITKEPDGESREETPDLELELGFPVKLSSRWSERRVGGAPLSGIALAGGGLAKWIVFEMVERPLVAASEPVAGCDAAPSSWERAQLNSCCPRSLEPRSTDQIHLL